MPSSLSRNTPGKSQLVVSWDDTSAFYENDLPAAESKHQPAIRRASVPCAAVNFDDFRNSFATQDFSVALTDTQGHSVEVPVSQFSNWLFFPPGKVSPLP